MDEKPIIQFTGQAAPAVLPDSPVGMIIAKMAFGADRHKVPIQKHQKHTQWVVFGEDDRYYNAYPQYLIELYCRSPKHGAILSHKALYMSGQGFEADTPTGLGMIDTLIMKPNPDETLNDILRKVAGDYEIHNAFALEIIYNKGGQIVQANPELGQTGIKRKIAEIRHIDVSKIRCAVGSSKYFYSTVWGDKKKPKDTEIIEYDPFNPEKPGDKQLLVYKCYRPGEATYALPDYIGSIVYIETDIEISNYHLNNIRNQFWGGKMISFNNGVPTIDAQRDIENKINGAHTGTDNAGRFILSFNNSKERAPEVHDISPGDSDKMFDILNKTVQQEIFCGHKITSPMLFGIRTEGQLGGRTELLEANELFRNNYIQPRQQHLLEVFNGIAQLMGYTEKLRIRQLDPVSKQETDLGPVMGPEKKPGGDDTTIDNLPGTKAPPAYRKFTAEDDSRLMEIFSRYGKSADDFYVLKKKNRWFKSAYEAIESETELLKDLYEVKTTSLDRKILDLLKGNPLITTDGIAEALKQDKSVIEKALEKMIKGGLINFNPKGGIDVSEIGISELDEKPVTTSISIVYEYDVAPGEGELIIPTTRQFCRDVIKMHKVFTRKEIEDISQEFGYSVWDYRGGYYGNRPYCRHIWVQEVVIKKS